MVKRQLSHLWVLARPSCKPVTGGPSRGGITMSRVPGVPIGEAGLLGRLAYRIARYRYRAVPEPVTVMLRHRSGRRAAAGA